MALRFAVNIDNKVEGGDGAQRFVVVAHGHGVVLTAPSAREKP